MPGTHSMMDKITYLERQLLAHENITASLSDDLTFRFQRLDAIIQSQQNQINELNLVIMDLLNTKPVYKPNTPYDSSGYTSYHKPSLKIDFNPNYSSSMPLSATVRHRIPKLREVPQLLHSIPKHPGLQRHSTAGHETQQHPQQLSRRKTTDHRHLLAPRVGALAEGSRVKLLPFSQETQGVQQPTHQDLQVHQVPEVRV